MKKATRTNKKWYICAGEAEIILKRELYQRFPEGIGCSLLLLEEQHIDPAEPGLPGASHRRLLRSPSRHAAHFKHAKRLRFLRQILSHCPRTPPLLFGAVCPRSAHRCCRCCCCISTAIRTLKLLVSAQNQSNPTSGNRVSPSTQRICWLSRLPASNTLLSPCYVDTLLSDHAVTT